MKTFNEIMKIRDEPDKSDETVAKRRFQIKKATSRTRSSRKPPHV